MLALHEMVKDGHEPVALLVMYRQEAGRSWVHGIEPRLLAAIGAALEIPLICCDAKDETYDKDIEHGLHQARGVGYAGVRFWRHRHAGPPGMGRGPMRRCGGGGNTTSMEDG